MRYEITEGTKEWLLSHPLPSVRYRALRSISRYPENHPAVAEARVEIMNSGPIATIIAKQRPEGYWWDEEDFYQRTKYRGTVWNIIVMAELDAIPTNEYVHKACEFVLSRSQVRDGSGFSYRGTLRNGGSAGGEIPCLTANMAWAIGKLGFEDDERIRKAIERISATQRFSITSPPDGPYHHAHDRCWNPRDCRSSAVKALRTLASVPLRSRTGAVSAAIKNGTDFVIENCLGSSPKDIDIVARKEWSSLGCPNMWNTDLLELACVLKKADARGKMFNELKRRIANMADVEGRLVQSSPYTKRFLTTIERKGEPSGLLTIRAYQLFNC